jgi:predicted component of type VI protein secretion system
MDVKLISVTPKGVQKSFTLNGPTMTIGRQPDCDVQVPHGLISRQHCQLQVNEEKLFIRDMKSSNGTYVNGTRITYTEVKAGDIIALGEIVKFMVQINGLPSKIDESKFQPGAPEAKARKAEAKPQKQKTAAAKPAATKPAAAAPKPAAKPATKPAGKPMAAPVEDEADNLLGESFFMDADEDEDEK